MCRSGGGADGNLTDVDSDDPRPAGSRQPATRPAEPASQVNKEPVCGQAEPGQRALQCLARARTGNIDAFRVLLPESLPVQVVKERIAGNRRVDPVVLCGTGRLGPV